MHDKGKVGLGLGGQHAGRGKPGVIDEGGIAVPRPLDGVGGIADDQLKGLVVPVLGRGQRVLAGNVKFVKAHVVEKHVDAAEVVGGDIDLLPEVAELHAVPAQHLGGFQQQRAGAAGGVVDLVDLCPAHGAQPGQQLRHLRGREELPAGFPRVGRVHHHEVFIGVPKGVNAVALDPAQVQAADAVEELHQLFVPLGDGGPQLTAVYIEVIKQPGESLLGGAALCGVLNVAKDRLQRLVQVFILGRSGPNVAEQLRGQHEKALFRDQPLPGLFRLRVREPSVVKAVVPGGDLPGVDVLCQILRDVAVEHGAEHIALEVPAVHAAPQLIGDGPDCPVELLALLLFPDVCHKLVPSCAASVLKIRY